MPRAYQVSPSPALGHDPNTGEWQALRGELVALLDHVEGHLVRPGQGEPEHDRLSLRLQELRQQVEPETISRREEALRSVQRAVDRFSERDETAGENRSPRDVLQSAIQEIRSKQGQAEPVAHRPHGALPRFNEMATAITGMSGRLERLESELNSHGPETGSVNEIAEQVKQLSHVIELLAGAVGETGQVKRLEAQIASLSQLITSGQKPDISVLASRIDLLGRTIEKLTKIQGQSQVRQSDQAAARDADLKRGILGIEEGIRNVYDRIDALERSSSLPQAEMEKIASGIAEVAAAVSGNNFKPQEIVKHIEDLHARIVEMEKRGEGNLSALKSEIFALKQTVVDATGPRFAAIETRLDALGTKLGEPRKPDPGVAAIEGQLKKLVERMDEAGTQISGLAKLYKQPGSKPASAPDFEALADLVANKTSKAFIDSGVKVPGAPQPLIDDSGIAELEKRLSKLFSEGRPADSQSLAQVEDGIRKVDERLDRLESAMARLQAPGTAPKPQSSSKSAHPLLSSALAGDAPPTAATDTSDAPAALRKSSGRDRDIMPRNPGTEAPLTDSLFMGAGISIPDPGPILPAAAKVDEVIARLSGKGSGKKAAPDSGEDVRPPRPHSSLLDPIEEALPHTVAPPVEPAGISPEPTSARAEPKASVSASTRNTFIEAHRRAQRQKAAVEPAAANSVISRALARFHNDGNLESELIAVESQPRPEAKPAKIAKTASAKSTRKKKAPLDELSITVVEEAPALQDDGADGKDGNLLMKHRRALLLGAALVTLSMLTVNLVSQRLPKGQADTVSASAEALEGTAATATNPTAAQATAALSGMPAGGIGIDDTPVGAIKPASVLSMTSPVEVAAMPDALQPVSVDTRDFAPETVHSPVEVEMPPEALGPLPLREAAAKGDARAQFEVAAIYTEGRVVAQDYAVAAKWYERAAAQGFAPAQYRLASLYETGTGVSKDLQQAKLWYQRAAEGGNRMSMHNLAALYAGGQLGEQEFDAAAEWFEQAALRGMTDSQFNLGMLYARGLGVEQDFGQSYKWFSLAANRGDADAAKARDDVAKSLDAAAMGMLADEIAAWKPTPVELAANFAPIGTWSADFDPGAPIESQDVVMKVQGALMRLGYDVGTPDGMSGPKTVEAIKAFEKGTGMSETGAINPRLLAVLGSQPV